MDIAQTPRLKAPAHAKRHWLACYAIAVGMFAAVVVVSIIFERIGSHINLTIPIVFAIVATTWWAGRGPGILISLMLEATTIIFIPIPPDSSFAKALFGWISILLLYLFLVFLISGLKNIQAKLRQQRDLLHLTLTSIGDAVITTDTGTRVTFMNPVGERLTGWPADAAEGTRLNEIVTLVDERTRRQLADPAEKLLSSGKEIFNSNHSVLVSRDGFERPIVNSAAPIVHEGNVVGTVIVISDASQQKAEELARRQQEIMEAIVDAQESERRRIARDLHDHMGQKMTALRLKIGTLSDKLSGDALRDAIGEVQQAASGIDRDIGYLSWELRPTELETLGLADALKSFVREWSQQYEIAADFNVTRGDGFGEVPRLDERVETNLYRITQEALNNVAKHSQADSVQVLLHFGEGQVSLVIEDNGVGFESDIHTTDHGTPGGFGLLGMQERAALLDGTFEIESSTGGGTAVVVRVPVDGDRPAASAAS